VLSRRTRRMLTGWLPSLRLPSARRLAFALLPLLALLLAAELAARALAPPEAPAGAAKGTEMVPHPTRIWAFAEGTITADGMTHQIGANRLRVVEETGAALRALTLGDSSIFGHGLDDADTLHASLADALTARGHPTDVFCGGVPGYSTEQSLLLLEEEGWDLKPDLLVIGNLWSDNSREDFIDRQWLDELDSPVRRLDRVLGWSAAWGWLRSFQKPKVKTLDGQLPIGWVREPLPTREGSRRVPLSDYAANLDRMLREAAARGVGAIVLAPANRHRLEPDRSFAMWDVYFAAQREVAERRGVPVVDALDALKAGGLTADEAFLDRMHPTGAGNRLYAGLLADTLLAAGWPADRLVPDAGPPPYDKALVDPFAELAPMMLEEDVRSDGPGGRVAPAGPGGAP
jgi:hypothetical protein